MQVVLVTQACPTLRDPVDCSPPGSSVHGDSPRKNAGMGCHALFQGIFPTQGSNSCLPHRRWILYPLSHQGSPRILEWVAILFSRRSSRPRDQTLGLRFNQIQGLLYCRRILYSLSHQGSLLQIGWRAVRGGTRRKQVTRDGKGYQGRRWRKVLRP